jgi:hypothetical protein
MNALGRFITAEMLLLIMETFIWPDVRTPPSKTPVN